MKHYVYEKLAKVYVWVAHVAPWPISLLEPLLDAILNKFEVSGS